MGPLGTAQLLGPAVTLCLGAETQSGVVHFSVAQIDVIAQGKLGVSFVVGRLPPRAAGGLRGASTCLPPGLVRQEGTSSPA